MLEEKHKESAYYVYLFTQEATFNQNQRHLQERIETLQLCPLFTQAEIEPYKQELNESILELADLGSLRFVVRACNQGLLNNWPGPTSAEAKAEPHRYNRYIPYAYSPTFDQAIYTSKIMPGEISQELKETGYEQFILNTNNGTRTTTRENRQQAPALVISVAQPTTFWTRMRHVDDSPPLTLSSPGASTQTLWARISKSGRKESPKTPAATMAQTQFNMH
jgi:hypothetical protein